jgi:hypothetical protein
MIGDARHAVGSRLEDAGVARRGRWAVLDAEGEAGDSGLIRLGRQT